PIRRGDTGQLAGRGIVGITEDTRRQSQRNQSATVTASTAVVAVVEDLPIGAGDAGQLPVWVISIAGNVTASSKIGRRVLIFQVHRSVTEPMRRPPRWSE